MSTTAPIDTSDAAPAGIPGAPNESLRDFAQRWWAGVRSGELGSLPIIVGLFLIAIIFQSQNDRFLTAGNFVNLIVQMAAITIIGMGIVFVLLLGEIDLSVGYVSGVAGVTTALLMIPDNSHVFGAGPRSRSRSSWGSGSGSSRG
jgi:D-xylose transport system permease protein